MRYGMLVGGQENHVPGCSTTELDNLVHLNVLKIRDRVPLGKE